MPSPTVLIAVMGNKGGTGKTTLAINMAAGLLRVAPTALLDLDIQRSAWQWSRVAQHAPSAQHIYTCDDDMDDALALLRERYHYIVMDCPPSVHAKETQAALRIANRVLVPVQPSPVDLWATLSVVEAVNAARSEHPKLQAHIVLNQLEAKTVLSRDIRAVIDEVGLDVLRSDIRRRAVYRNAMAEGKTVFEMGKNGHESATEIERLVMEVTGS